jgi:hypothetical protein
LLISARAMATRCFWPPLIWPGLLVGLVLHLDQRQHRSTRGDLGARAARHAQAEGDVLPHRQVREERVVLEDRVDLAAVGAAGR